MSTTPERQPIPVEEYLRGERQSETKHEYLGGFEYAMAGANNAHNRIASNVLGALYSRLRGKSCEPYNSDTKIRVKLPTQVRFYYPDASVVCEPNPPRDSFQDRPVVIVEVMSRKTRRTDESERKEAYLTIPTLAAYLLIEPDRPSVSVYRRVEQGFVQEAFNGLASTIPLNEIEADLPMRDVYDRVDFVPEPEDEDE